MWVKKRRNPGKNPLASDLDFRTLIITLSALQLPKEALLADPPPLNP